VARKQIELATCSLRQITVKLWIFFTANIIELCAVISLSLGDDFVSKSHPTQPRVPAHSPFHEQLTEKRKDGRLYHLLVAKRTSRVSL
jgi:hypothetical protein